ncbi:phosphodiesterase [Stappia indica]|uniref:phosphodiesterase n=1 Tax=Stappia indica TaxID=538381 RepID=UPI001CD79974|nr:phosphodiesterase [Stappia indica]MCA1297448.1 phosphodiesterase [Stappia indica]
MTVIAQISDLHIRPQGLACYRVSETNMLAERAMSALNRLDPQPDAIIVTGDLADMPDPREYAGVQRLLASLKAPVYVLPGNHDSTAMMRERLTGVGPIGEGTADKMHYAVTIGDVRLIALDSSVPGAAHGELGPDQLAWLDRTLGADTTPTLIAVHHPPKSLGIEHMDQIGLQDGEAFAEVVGRHPHVARILCGHVHRTIIAEVGGRVMTLAPSTGHQVALAFGDDAPAHFIMEPPGYFLHRFTEQSGVISHLAYVEPFPGPYPFFADEGVDW